MRELKFRAWDDEAKRMYSPEGLEQPEIQDNTKKTIYSYLSFGVLCIYDFRDKEPIEFVPMQSTDWYDKNNKEIYEGDIVQIGDTIHQIIWSEDIAGFVVLSTDGMALMGGDYLRDEIEIIGNIYENHDLINYKC
ncbi:putative phage protein (TIGR01671 family) [Sedimentibacter acidaminivorans]|uniref:Phage protein (TIGR01671 family) n=1 Tax=Sedimentibacter acidaminivorans TaxID=913099 RepID=A0ABS4GIA9_9FIRM|nr:YopX family protein [Sedimentibacter acidaminivorans]MBP1927421.1 putative phage protein (TIGR01671 family) [Sedimentibacter acidaminivorans]